MNKLHVEALYSIEPLVAGQLGPGTTLRNTELGIPQVEKLEYIFDDHYDDEIVTSHPCYLISSELYAELESNGITGLAYGDAVVCLSEQASSPEILRDFVWLKPTGRLSAFPRTLNLSTIDDSIWSGHDVSIGPKASLVFSWKALATVGVERIPSSSVRTCPVARRASRVERATHARHSRFRK